MSPRPVSRSAPHPGRKRLRRRRRRGARVAAAILAIAAVAIAVAVVTATGLGPASRHPLVASSQRQPAAGTSSPADGGGDGDQAAIDEAAPAPNGPSHHDSAPGHAQGGSSLPSPAAGPSVTVPILLYHYIRGNPRASDREGFRLSVTPAELRPADGPAPRRRGPHRLPRRRDGGARSRRPEAAAPLGGPHLRRRPRRLRLPRRRRCSRSTASPRPPSWSPASWGGRAT